MEKGRIYYDEVNEIYGVNETNAYYTFNSF